MWPNWVDVVIITLLLRTCYIGFTRGFLVELVSLIAVVTATVLTCHVHARAAQFVSPWWPFNHSILSFACFVLLLVASAVIGASVIVHLCARLLQESPLRRALP
ncbi:MAG: CvpA family protein, partial [Candidatus Omnitrophica bacterium]|nr:CvpA family protein [Candidatus Omnitrophota bacterium]